MIKEKENRKRINVGREAMPNGAYQSDYKSQRELMVQKQLAGRDITDKRVLSVMAEIPREKFIPTQWREYAYEDRAVPIGLGQTISQPYMVAIMTQLLELTEEHRVLEIGTGSGYQTAILAKLSKEVFTVERIPELSERAKKVLSELGITNVRFKIDDGTLGWPEYSPYDRIIVTAGAPSVPEALTEQLSENGIMVIPVGPEEHQTLIKLTKSDGKIYKEHILSCRFVKLIGQEGWQESAELL